MAKIIEYDQKRRKRLLLFIPVGIIAIAVLLITVERTRVVDKFFSIGYEGPMQILPEITIIDDKGMEAEIFSKERRDMVARDIQLFSEEEEDIEEEEPEISTAPEKELEEQILDEVPGQDYIRTYPSHSDVPYREDYVIIHMVQPEYPKDALDRMMEGYVLVEVYVDETGRVSEAWVRKVYGMESFERSSIEAVRQFVFKPVMENGSPQPFWVSFLVNFRLRS